MTSPAEYFDLDGLRLNSGPGGWWCDFELYPLPIWGLAQTRNAPGIVVPGLDGQLATNVTLDAVRSTIIGTVYGDFDLTGSPVAGGLSACRVQLRQNIAALQARVKQRVTGTCHLYGGEFRADITVVSLRQGAGDTTGPMSLVVALELFFPDGEMVHPGS